jgi:hypothetical protein
MIISNCGRINRKRNIHIILPMSPITPPINTPIITTYIISRRKSITWCRRTC